MKYYIFGTNKSNQVIKTTAAKALFETDDFDEALDVFQKYINEIRKNKLYLIADFEYVEKPYLKYTNIDIDYEDHMPFFIIGEWHLGLNNDMFIRADRTQVTMKGFTRDFSDNLAAFKYFQWCFENEKDSEFRIIYKERLFKNGHLYYKLFNRKIISTSELSAFQNRHPTKKFYILHLCWEPVPVEKNTRSINEYFLEVKMNV